MNASHPPSPFRAVLMAAPPAPDGRYALLHNKLTVHHLGGPTEKRTIATAAELRAVVARDFLLALPSDPELDDALERIAAR